MSVEAQHLGIAAETGNAQGAGVYWEGRARRFAMQGEGLAAVCSYGMPEFYNRMIQWTQRRALSPWLSVAPGARVLDIGCGVGRWSRWLAARGADVTGIDVSPTMIAEAQRRAHQAGLSARCQFAVQDLAQLDAGGPYELVLAVTVLQHVLDEQRLRAGLARMVHHLAPRGRMLLLEAAPSRIDQRCDTAIFRARSRDRYEELFADSGLKLLRVVGVDPAPFKLWLLPYLKRLPRPLGVAATAAVSVASLPVDALLAHRLPERSWHALFVLEHVSPARTGRARTSPLRTGPAHSSRQHTGEPERTAL
ncbi:MAG TPA: class I SAM-dependent methyltransferase [Steroidobacteraceae bacterium]|nr:class I SAM-dependent methyltransferase [Steroidobacteraceae bacterium]